jgi:hypothetical protein
MLTHQILAVSLSLFLAFLLIKMLAYFIYYWAAQYTITHYLYSTNQAKYIPFARAMIPFYNVILYFWIFRQSFYFGSNVEGYNLLENIKKEFVAERKAMEDDESSEI